MGVPGVFHAGGGIVRGVGSSVGSTSGTAQARANRWGYEYVFSPRRMQWLHVVHATCALIPPLHPKGNAVVPGCLPWDTQLQGWPGCRHWNGPGHIGDILTQPAPRWHGAPHGQAEPIAPRTGPRGGAATAVPPKSFHLPHHSHRQPHQRPRRTPVALELQYLAALLQAPAPGCASHSAHRLRGTHPTLPTSSAPPAGLSACQPQARRRPWCHGHGRRAPVGCPAPASAPAGRRKPCPVLWGPRGPHKRGLWLQEPVPPAPGRQEHPETVPAAFPWESFPFRSFRWLVAAIFPAEAAGEGSFVAAAFPCA